MHWNGAEFESNQNDSYNAEDTASQQETLTRLQYMVAFLIEKNERMRQQLSAGSYEERA